MAFAVLSAARLPLLPPSRAGPLTTLQTSRNAADRSVASPKGHLTLGFDPARFQTEPPVCYRASWQLPGPDFHRQATTSTNHKTTPLHHEVTSQFRWAHESPGLANLFMHYAFDAWMAREYPNVQFERYADDAVVHCVTESQAQRLRVAIENRMAEVGLRLHPTKTRIVYCKDGRRRLEYEHTDFTFLGFTFRARGARGNGGNFTGFLPAISKDALNRLSRQLREWRLHVHTGHTLSELARQINPIVRGWMQYYGAFTRSALYPLLQRINAYLVRWLRRKYRRLRPFKKAKACWQRIISQQPRLFAHWASRTGFW